MSATLPESIKYFREQEWLRTHPPIKRLFMCICLIILDIGRHLLWLDCDQIYYSANHIMMKYIHKQYKSCTRKCLDVCIWTMKRPTLSYILTNMLLPKYYNLNIIQMIPISNILYQWYQNSTNDNYIIRRFSNITMIQSALYSVQRLFAIRPRLMSYCRWRTSDERQRELGAANGTHT